ncbi:MAG: mechanosensitive ion channel [Terrimicrobiaceae bacterium]|nr:mechanosensitive ion channel [Terrimicrobiaceae bacterium]
MLRLLVAAEPTPADTPDVLDHAGTLVQSIWTMELYPFGGAHLTLGKIVLALGGLVLAIMVALIFARWVSGVAKRRLSYDVGQRVMLERIVFFPLAALLVFTVLNWLAIPLTAFAFLGGALAIGVGFGAQTLINNFISGLILLTERQIRIGDIIEVGASTGIITHLGSRYSRLRKFDGVEVLIPNSLFLEKEVANWTLNDRQHRFDFTIGVDYGSDAKRVLEILEVCTREEPGVLADPAPAVFFESFGDSALVFRIYFWVEVGGAFDARAVGSNIRCRMDQRLREAGISIPFPQRDINLPGTVSVRLEK